MYMFYFFSSPNLSDRKITEVKDNIFLIMLRMGNEDLSRLEIWQILGRRILDLIMVGNSSDRIILKITSHLRKIKVPERQQTQTDRLRQWWWMQIVEMSVRKGCLWIGRYYSKHIPVYHGKLSCLDKLVFHLKHSMCCL